jgi:hypothetical protein
MIRRLIRALSGTVFEIERGARSGGVHQTTTKNMARICESRMIEDKDYALLVMRVGALPDDLVRFSGWITVKDWAEESFERAKVLHPESRVCLVTKVKQWQRDNEPTTDWWRSSALGKVKP